MAIALALCAAAAWGWSDFIGGTTSRSQHHVPVALWSQVLGLLPLLLVAPLFAPLDAVTGTDVALGALAGVGGALGLVMLYRGLAAGRMAVVAPVTALGAAGLPVLWGVAVDGEAPSWVAWSGLVLALVAIWLVASGHDADRHGPAPRAAGVPDALAASVGFSIVFIALDRTSAGSGLWPLLPSRVVLVALVVALALATRAPRRPDRHAWGALGAIALLDTLAISAYLLATREGLLAIVAVLASLYPAGTVLLARVRLREHLVGRQLRGLALAAAAVTLISIG